MTEKIKEKKPYQKIRCPNCNSGFNYYKLREKIWQCRSCGEKFKFDKRKLGNINERNGAWKGNDVGYINLHNWVRRRKEKPQFCEICKENKPIDLANISGEYKRDINDYRWVCRSCHMKDDGRIMKNLKQFKVKREIKN